MLRSLDLGDGVGSNTTAATKCDGAGTEWLRLRRIDEGCEEKSYYIWLRKAAPFIQTGPCAQKLLEKVKMISERCKGA